MVLKALFCWELNVPLSLCRPPHPLTKKAVGEGETCSQSTLRKCHCFFLILFRFCCCCCCFFAFGRAGEGLAERRGLWKKWKAMFENLKIKQGLPIAIYIACVASVSARVRRELWDESKKKRNDGEGEATVILYRDMGNSVFPLLPFPSPFHFFFRSRSNFRAITWLKTLATQATIYIFQSMVRNDVKYIWNNSFLNYR